MKKRLPILLVCFLVVTACFVTLPPAISFAEDETELFLVAQKAFDDGFYDVAMRYVQQFLEQYPQSNKRIPADILLGQCYFFKGQYLKAFEIFQGLLQFNDFKDATLFWLGETYLKDSDFVQAEKQYRQLLEVYPDSMYASQGLYSLGWTLFEQKKFKEAKSIFLELIKKFPAHELTEDGLFKVGECEYNQHEYQNAVEYFRNYLSRFPQSRRHDQVYFYIGESYYYLENFRDAIEYYGKVTEISKDDKIILLSKISMGWCYFKLGEFEPSKQFFEEAQVFAQEKNIPSDDIDLGRANLAAQMKDYPTALAAYDHLIATFPGSPRVIEATLGKANVLYILGNYPDAITQYKILIEKYSPDPNLGDLIEKANIGLAWAYLKNGATDLSIQTFQAVVNQTSNNSVKISTLTQIGDAYQDANRIDKAIETYDTILKDYPDNPYTDYVQYRQGIALLKQNKIEAATLAFKTLQTNFPQSKYLSDTKYYLGLAYFKKGEWAAAKEQLSEFLAQPSVAKDFEADAQYLLGLSLFNTEDYNEAMKVFSKITKNFPDQTSLVSNCEINIAKCIYNLGDIKEALKRFKIIAYKYPRTEAELESLQWLGDYYLKSSDFNNAITYYQQMIEYFPGSEKIAQAHYGLGQAYQEMGTFDKALNEFKLIGNDENKELYSKARLSIADIFSKDSSPDSAIEAYKKITETSPEFSRDAHVKIAEAYQNQRDYDHALAAYRKALESEAGLSKVINAEIQFNIGDIYETQNKINEAAENYLKIPYLYPEETGWAVKVYLRLARIFEHQEDWENAKTIYQKIISYGTEEMKFAEERLQWIKANIVPSKAR